MHGSLGCLRAEAVDHFRFVSHRLNGRWPPSSYLNRQELTVGVGEKPEFLDQEAPIPSGRGGNGRGAKRTSARKKRAAAAPAPDRTDEVPASDRRRSREPSLHRL